ncbi:hypothetical protein [Xanthomonas campestris]|uniref:hypothetical protein n=1 Tax=Xanthomonas campestris TaxID=339 RepID=UPI000B0CAFC5|nr:hypothetical protein [Xanthomonas campestris]MEA9830504.1 hypothetical protein [Xanthomonas campestris pv. raphani]
MSYVFRIRWWCLGLPTQSATRNVGQLPRAANRESMKQHEKTDLARAFVHWTPKNTRKKRSGFAWRGMLRAV